MKSEHGIFHRQKTIKSSNGKASNTKTTANVMPPLARSSTRVDKAHKHHFFHRHRPTDTVMTDRSTPVVQAARINDVTQDLKVTAPIPVAQISGPIQSVQANNGTLTRSSTTKADRKAVNKAEKPGHHFFHHKKAVAPMPSVPAVMPTAQINLAQGPPQAHQTTPLFLVKGSEIFSI